MIDHEQLHEGEDHQDRREWVTPKLEELDVAKETGAGLFPDPTIEDAFYYPS